MICLRILLNTIFSLPLSFRNRPEKKDTKTAESFNILKRGSKVFVI